MTIKIESTKTDEPLGVVHIETKPDAKPDAKPGSNKVITLPNDMLKMSKTKKSDPSFGCLKNGKKPTFKQWKLNPAANTTPTVKHFAKFGKDAKNKTIRVHLNDASGYKKIKKGIEKLEKEPLSVVCKYLADRNLYKAGSAAPEDILRETYKNAYLTGNIENRDADVMMHNFMHGQTDP